ADDSWPVREKVGLQIAHQSEAIIGPVGGDAAESLQVLDLELTIHACSVHSARALTVGDEQWGMLRAEKTRAECVWRQGSLRRDTDEWRQVCGGGAQFLGGKRSK